MPAVLLGIACLFVLAEELENVAWLSTGGRSWRSGQLASERAVIERRHPASLPSAPAGWRILMFVAVNFLLVIGSLGLSLRIARPEPSDAANPARQRIGHGSAWNALKNREAEGLIALPARANPRTMSGALLA